MAINDEKITRLETAATAGDARAARELGRLLSLTVTDDPEADQTWPEERWLRAALKADPHDVEPLMLLTGRLAQQVSYWENGLEMNPDMVGECGEDEGTVERRRTEAQELYARIRAIGPGVDAEAGLDELAVLLGLSDKPPAEDTYSFYLLEDEVWSGSVVHAAIIVASDPDEIRWACDRWLALSDGGFGGPPTLLTYVDGSEVSSIDLGEHSTDGVMGWATVAVPELTGTRLPSGLPVPGRDLYYGFSARVE
ncbi:tetratricopeptide repeat protein [Streptomyces sp. NPDC048581]|uniref:tetratricopeptide repeat protein n=1 Tax=Streptomyces sp. NPDC048581 TaxID=3365572 RepID=UPI00371B1A63